MSAAVLVLVVLGAIAVDAAVVFLGQRELGSATAAAANDAAGAAFADAPFYEGGQVELDPAAAARVADASIRARLARGVDFVGSPRVTIVGRQVCVEAEAVVKRIFGAAIPGVSRTVTIHARSAASLADAGGPARDAVCQT
jgi:hypothetical protein